LADEPAPSHATGRDFGCGLVSLLAATMLAGSLVGAIIALSTHGPSFSLIVSATLSLLFWCWIAMGAWRRTTWSALEDHRRRTGDRGPHARSR
jgi:ABC-type transport system involved in Fe-S cluster assembly fused permease/ATPase subunit